METINNIPDLGGNIKLYIVPYHLIHTISGLVITFTGSDPTCELDCALESIKYIFKNTETRAGLLYEHTLTAFIQGRTQENEDILIRMLPTRHVVILEDAVGIHWRIGSLTEPIRLIVDFDSAADPSHKNGYAITLTGFTTIPSKLVNFPLIQG